MPHGTQARPLDEAHRLQSVVAKVLNHLKTAKTLGLTIPQSVLLRADQIIE